MSHDYDSSTFHAFLMKRLHLLQRVKLTRLYLYEHRLCELTFQRRLWVIFFCAHVMVPACACVSSNKSLWEPPKASTRLNIHQESETAMFSLLWIPTLWPNETNPLGSMQATWLLSRYVQQKDEIDQLSFDHFEIIVLSLYIPLYPLFLFCVKSLRLSLFWILSLLL